MQAMQAMQAMQCRRASPVKHAAQGRAKAI